MENQANAPAKVEIPVQITKKQRKMLVDITYSHSKDTFSKKDKIDWFVVLCGIIAFACLCYSAYNVYVHGIDVIFGILMCVYAIVAIFCFSKNLQISMLRRSWKRSLKRRIVFGKKGGTVAFDDEKITYTHRNKEKKVYFEKMWDAYETDEFFIFHADEHCIIPVSKSVVVGLEQDGRKDLIAYFGGLLSKADFGLTRDNS